MNQVKVLLERFPYRYVSVGVLENGYPDYRIQKANEYTKRYSDMYLLDNQMQLLTASVCLGWGTRKRVSRLPNPESK